MKEEKPHLHILLMEDDKENLHLLQQSLPTELEGYELIWEPCDDFDEALSRLKIRRYDLVVTDVYRDRGGARKGIDAEDERARDIVREIRNRRFTPIVAFTDGSFPESFQEGPFVKLANKSSGDTEIINQISELIKTGIPALARQLHDELDKEAGSYLWDFLESKWQHLVEKKLADPSTLERLIRRRASIQLGKIDPKSREAAEIASIEGLEFYIYPSISKNELRLGEILRHKESGEFRLVLTPHCHLTVQTGESAPRADYVLTVLAVDAKKLWQLYPMAAKKEAKRLDELRRRIKSPADIGKPEGRYWFLPNFLDIPAMYCDFLRMESIPYETIKADYNSIAVLDAPFAEAMQSCFTKFYSAVGLANLKTERFTDLMPPEEGAKES